MSYQNELEQIRSQSPDGVLYAENVVEFAKRPDTALHGYFTWDDNAAAAKWRIHQARNLIRLHVTVIKPDTPEVRTYVSLMSDRYETGGYRYTPDVLSDADMRKELLRTALKELASLRTKYAALKELSSVFEAIDRLRTTDASVSAERTVTNEVAVLV